MAPRKSVIEDVTDKLDRDAAKPDCKMKKEDALSTGSTILNLSLSGMVEGGFFPKRYYIYVGDSGAGKTFLTMTAFAEACQNPRYAKHRLIHDNAEDGALMDFSEFFGKGVDQRLEPPLGTRARPVYSRTVEDFYRNLDVLFKAKRPFIYILDSMDALGSEAGEKHFKALAKAKDGDEVSGSYGTAKAKENSSGLTRVAADLRESDSILIIIAHAKVNIGKDAFYRPKSRSGGLSLKYFAHAEMWTSVGAAINTTVNEKVRKQGSLINIKIEKNRQTGQEGRLIEIPILRHLGIDDISSCIDYLIEEKHWKAAEGKKVHAAEFFEDPVTIPRLIKTIEDESLEPELRMLVGEVWKDIENRINPHRKKRFL